MPKPTDEVLEYILANLPSAELHRRVRKLGLRVVRSDRLWFETDPEEEGILIGRGHPTRAELCRALLRRAGTAAGDES